MEKKSVQSTLSHIKHQDPNIIARVLMLALLTSIGSSKVIAAPATDRPVVDLRTWPTPNTDLSKLPNDEQSRMIKMGQELLTHTSAYLGPEMLDPSKRYAGSNMSCSSCHRAAATMPYAAPLIGTYGAYPQFQPRFGKTVTLENRINLCFTHSLAGRPIREDSTEMKAFVAYIEYLSHGVPKGAKLIGEKEMVVVEPKRAANLVRGEEVYKQQCAVCHNDNGQGKRVGTVGDRKGYAFPPVWGSDATSESASMFRILSAFQYIYVNMPFGQATFDRPALSKDDAYDVAGFVVSHPRQPREGEVAKDFSNPYDKPEDFPWGPYVDSFTETQHKYGPYDVIRAVDAAANVKAKEVREAKSNPSSPPASK
jgi:thiosulfate dehydrogenase